MANGNPFSIVPVDVPGVFAAVGRLKESKQRQRLGALNLQLGQEQLNAFRQDRERQQQIQGLKTDVIAGRPGAIDQLAEADTGEAKDLVDLYGALDKQDKERADAKALELAQAATRARLLGGEERADFVAGFLENNSDFVGKISANPDDAELDGLVINTQSAVNLLKILNPDKKSPKLMAIGTVGADGKLIIEEVVDLNNDPNGVEKIKAAAKQGKAIFDPEEAGAGQGIGTEAQRFDAQKEFNEKTEATANLVKETARLLGQVETAGTKAIGFAGGVTRFVDNFAEQVGATAELLGFERKADELLAGIGGDTENRFKQIANESAVIASNLKSLAYLTAKSRFGQTGRGLSDKDFENALKIVAGAAQSPSQMTAVLRENITAVVSQLETAAQAGNFDFSIEAFEEQFGLVDLQGDDLPLITDQAGFDALPSGTKYRETPNGPIFEKP